MTDQRADERNGPYPLSHVLRAELEAIRSGEAQRPVLDALACACPGNGPVPVDEAGLRDELAHRSAAYAAAHAMNLSALCLSGGGIRSASFSLGVIQALAERRLLQKFDYLSTVSGGGYIGAWLTAWLRHGSLGEVLAGLDSRRAAPDRDPPAIRHLRQYSQYLTPRAGLMSGDTWAAAAIILRNLVLTWLVLVPAICIPVVFVKIIGGILHTARFAAWPSAAGIAVAIFCLLLVALSLGYQFHRLYFYRRICPGADEQREFLWRCLAPAVVAGAGLAWVANLRSGGAGFPLGIGIAAVYVLTALAIRPVIAGRRRRRLARRSSPRPPAMRVAAMRRLKHHARSVFAPKSSPRRSDILAWTVAGIATGALVWTGADLYAAIGDRERSGTANPATVWAQALLLVFGLPWLLMATRFGTIFYVLFRSYSRSSDFEREWLGRAGGWALIAALAWIVLSGLVLVGSVLSWYRFHPNWIALIGAGFGLAARFLGKSGAMPGGGAGRNWQRVAANVGLAIAGPLFMAVLIVLLSMLFDRIVVRGGNSFLSSEMFSSPTPGKTYVLEWAITAGVVAALIATGVIADLFVNVNRFSLHALYRNRLIRAFLGAGHGDRRPDGFTGFDQKDNIRVHDLWPPPGGEWRPFPVINIALNLASSRELAWQQRKAMSFTVTPLYCGAADLGYRRTERYGDPSGGISLGTAMAISGAAVSPGMGYRSSPSLAFLLTFFNVRLGWWLGNPGPAGDRAPSAAWRRRLVRLPSGDRARPLEPFAQDAPPLSLRPILAELFGQTNEDSPYVYLSDGGHFENLGLYEMVRRRCKWIVVIDGGCDPGRGFADLGNAARKIWIDLGVRITFAEAKLLQADENARPLDIPYFAVGTIDYIGDPSGPDGRPPQGRLLYVKPTVRCDETGPDIIAYKRGNPLFPHQPTADQWFDEPQLETYRALGRYIMDRIINAAAAGSGGPPAAFDDLFRHLLRVDPATLARLRADSAASG